MKTVSIFWQSHSGNNFACVKAATEEFEKAGVAVKTQSILSKESLPLEAELYVFIFPVFNFKPATAMRDFIMNLPETVRGRKVLVIVNCGGFWANVPAIMKKLLKEKGMFLCGALKTRGSESYIVLRKYIKALNNGGMPDAKELEKVRVFIANACQTELKPENYFFNPLSLFHWMGRFAPDNAPGRTFRHRVWDKEKCTLCGYCYKLCPSGAITKEGADLKCDEKKCVGCCGCFNICPVNAWETPAFKKEYFYKGEYAKELIKTLKGK